MKTLFASILGMMFVTLCAFVVYVIFVVVPVEIYTTGECLEKGYPRSAVSFGLNRYCMNLEGSVTVKVEAQK